MPELTKSTTPPPYFEGRRLPLGDLSPSDFEKFVAACLVCVGDAYGIEVLGLPTGSGDGGFDASGRDLLTKRVVCIQCKRQIAKLGIAKVAHEIAKVAANSILKNIDVGQHWFLCTGGITTEVVTLLRGNFHATLAEEAGNRLVDVSEGELKSLREKLIALGEDPRDVIKRYVDGLDKLVAWDQEGFDVALTSRWSDVVQVIEKYFNVASVVREQPRALFDRLYYVRSFSNFSAEIRPRFAKAKLPTGMSLRSSRGAAPDQVRAAEIRDISELSNLKEGELVVLIGDGGAGKTTVLELVRAEVLKTSSESAIAVLIPLANYTPGNLDNLIQIELGVDFGTWRSLPDRVVLLFDGLNECPSSFVINLLNDLDTILRRRLAACIVSTREATRHRSITLPIAPLACLRVERITPTAVRRFAESRLNPIKVGEFESAYLELANRIHAPHLWNPFALEVALEYWTASTSLPATLGEMIEAVIRSRCERDARNPSQPVGPAVIVAFAGALAFVNLIGNKRLECPEIEAGKWILDAKVFCQNALGIADMTQLEIVGLLKHHEILRLSSTNHYSFGHQLLVGALAAPILSLNWREFLNSTEDPMADDAWIFAARLIPCADISKFLQEMLNADLMLGARVARELPSHYQELAEKYLLKCVEDTSPESVQLRGVFALSLLATPNAITKIREIAKDRDRNTSYRARQALAATGDRNLLRALMPSVESMRAGPGTMSGGDLGIWERAPYSSRLEVAREWLKQCRPGSIVKESLLLIAFEEEPNDIGLVERQLVPGIELSQWAHVLYALYKLNRNRASDVFQEAIASTADPLTQAKLFRIAADIGVPYDIHQAFECALTDCVDGPQANSLDYELHLLTENVIVKEELPASLIAIVECELNAATDSDRTGRLWMIAATFISPLVAEIAEKRLSLWGEDLGYVCNYFTRQPQLIMTRKQKILEICETMLSRKENWHTWHAGRALALIGTIGYTVAAATCVSNMVQQITRIRIALERDNLASLNPEDFAVIAKVKPEHLEVHLDGLAAALIPSAARAKRLLSTDTKLAFLYFDMSFTGGIRDDYRELLFGIDNDQADAVFDEISRAGVRVSSLCALCECALTERRIWLLAEEITKNADIPPRLNSLATAVDVCWNDSVSQMIITTVANIPHWTHDQFFWDFADVVANHLEQKDSIYLNPAILAARTEFSKKILRLWRDKAVGARVGFSRIVSET